MKIFLSIICTILIVAFVLALNPSLLNKPVDLALTQFPNQPQLREIGVKLDRPIALKARFYELKPGSKPWLKLGRNIAPEHADVAFTLSEYFVKTSKQHQANLWLTKAIKLGYGPAVYAQAQTLIDNKEYEQAELLVKRLREQPESYWEIHLRLALATENGQSVLEAFTQLSKQNSSHPLINQMQRFAVIQYWQNAVNSASVISSKKIDNDPRNSDFNVEKQLCNTSVGFYAGNLEVLQRAELLIDEVRQQTFFNNEFCFSTPQYLPETKLGCRVHESGRIVCQSRQIIATIDAEQSDYIGVMTEKGNANVNHGILYLDLADDAAILKHELMHLIGFIDEYPLPANHQVCQVNELTAVAKNVVVDSLPRTSFNSEQQARDMVLAKLPWGSLIKNTTPITKIEAGKRVLGTPAAFSGEVGVFASQTCDKQNRMSYKPQQGWGLLRYNSLPLSEVYQRIHALNPGRFAMQRPPVQSNKP